MDAVKPEHDASARPASAELLGRIHDAAVSPPAREAVLDPEALEPVPREGRGP